MHLYQTELIEATYMQIHTCKHIYAYVHPYTHIYTKHAYIHIPIHTCKNIFFFKELACDRGAGQYRICRAGQQAGICWSGPNAAALRQSFFLRETSVML